MGVQRNFEKAISLCHGDIIFLSDQDDVWEPEKVRTITDWFQKNPTKKVLFSDASLIDENGINIPNDSLWNRVEYSRREQFWFMFGLGLEAFLHGNIATGATMALRKEAKEYVSVLPDMSIYQDEILAETALIDNSLGFIPKQLIKYRLHDSQVCGIIPHQPRVSAIKPFWYGHRLDRLPGYEKIQKRILWGAERLKSKHYWFGGFVIRHLMYYIHIYGLKCGMVIIANDIIDSWHHSFYRIRNKIIRTLRFK